MKQTKIIMGMPVTAEISTGSFGDKLFDIVFEYFKYVDEKFSTYKNESEITRLNRGQIAERELSQDARAVLALSEETKRATNGYFDIFKNGVRDPSGLVKGWAIYNAANLLKKKGLNRFYIEAGGDIEARGKYWKVGIKNPFYPEEIVKVLRVKDKGVATSGTYERGQHIYNPKNLARSITDIVSLTVIGPNIYEADRFATAAFAMGRAGINFIENLKDMEGYMIDQYGLATFTSGFEKYTI